MTIVNALPYNLTNGTTADATQVMGDLNAIVTDVNTNAAHSGANSDITALTGLTTPLANTYGGTNRYTGGTATGTGDALVLATTVPNNLTLTAGKIVTGVASDDCTGGAVTLNAHATGATAVKVITDAGLVNPPQGAIVTGGAYEFYYDGTRYVLLNPTLPAHLVTNASAVGTDGDIPVFNGAATDLGDSGIHYSNLALLDAANAFTQLQTGVTPASNDISTKLATTEFVNPANSIGTNGYQKLASGLIIQWGITVNYVGNVSHVTTFPLAFPTACLVVVSQPTNSGSSGPTAVTAKTTTTFTMQNNTNASQTFYWSAIGY